MRSFVAAGKTLPRWVLWVQECFFNLKILWILHQLSEGFFDKIQKQCNNDNNNNNNNDNNDNNSNNNNNNDKNNNHNKGTYWKVILHHFQTIALFSWQDRACTIPWKNILTILKCKAPLKSKNSSELILWKLLILWKFPGPPCWRGMSAMIL